MLIGEIEACGSDYVEVFEDRKLKLDREEVDLDFFPTSWYNRH